MLKTFQQSRQRKLKLGLKQAKNFEIIWHTFNLCPFRKHSTGNSYFDNKLFCTKFWYIFNVTMTMIKIQLTRNLGKYWIMIWQALPVLNVHEITSCSWQTIHDNKYLGVRCLLLILSSSYAEPLHLSTINRPAPGTNTQDNHNHFKNTHQIESTRYI